MLRREVRLAIEIASNVPYQMLNAEEVCKAMRISAGTLRRYEEMFGIPVHRIGRKKFYFEAEIKSCIVTRMRFWKA